MPKISRQSKRIYKYEPYCTTKFKNNIEIQKNIRCTFNKSIVNYKFISHIGSELYLYILKLFFLNLLLIL